MFTILHDGFELGLLLRILRSNCLVDLIRALCAVVGCAFYAQDTRLKLVLQQLISSYLRLLEVFEFSHFAQPIDLLLMLLKRFLVALQIASLLHIRRGSTVIYFITPC